MFKCIPLIEAPVMLSLWTVLLDLATESNMQKRCRYSLQKRDGTSALDWHFLSIVQYTPFVQRKVLVFS